jgi:hypothetical protein
MYRYGVDFDHERGMEEILIDFLQKKAPSDKNKPVEKEEQSVESDESNI